MKKLFKRSSSKKNKTNLDGSFANVSVDSSPGRPISQLSQYSADSNYSLSNVSIDSLGPGRGYVLAKKQKLPPTCKAAWKGDLKKLKKALKKGHVNEQDKDNRTPLHYACAQGHNEIISHLLSTGFVSPNIQDDEGKTPLIKACECNQVTSAQLLIEHPEYVQPINCSLPDNDGNTPLILAILSENVDIASLLVISEVDVNCCNREGESPMIIASRKNNMELVELLGAEGANINAVDNEGRSALMIAAKNNHVSIARYLLSLFPDTSIKDKHGWAAFDFAQICADNTCLRLLEDHDKRCGNPDFNPEHDNLTTINSQDDAVNHKNSANDWTAPPDGDLTEDENSFMSSPIELNGASSPDIPGPDDTNGEDIEIDVDQVLTSDKSVSEVDLSITADKSVTPSKPGSAVNRLLDALNQSEELSEGQLPVQSPSSTPSGGDNSLGQISNLQDDDGSSINLSSEDIGYIPTMPMSDNNEDEPMKKDDLKAKLGFDLDEEESSTTHTVTKPIDAPELDLSVASNQSDSSGRKRLELPPTPRTAENSEGSTPKASPRQGHGYSLDDEDSTLSSITEKTEPVGSPDLGEVVSPDPISPLPDNTLSDSISINSDVEISGYMSESLRSNASGRKSISPKGDTPSDFRMTPLNDQQLDRSLTRSNSGEPSAGNSISSGVRSRSGSNRRTPPQTPPSNRSLADGVRSSKTSPANSRKVSPSNSLSCSQSNSLHSEPKLHFGNMMGGDDSDTSESTMNDDLKDESPSKSEESKPKSEINDLSIVSNSKSSLTDRNILSPTLQKPDLSGKEISQSEGITDDIMESDDEAEMLLAQSSKILSAASMNVIIQDDEVRVPAGFAPDAPPIDIADYETPSHKDEQKSSSMYGGPDVTVDSESSSDESETGKLAKKYIAAKKSREESPVVKPSSSSNSNYCSSMSPMEGEYIVGSVPTSKHVTPRVSFGNAPLCFGEPPERTSTPIKPEKDEESAPHSSQHPASISDPAISAKFEDIERRKSEAERELEEIRKTRRSQSPVSMSESYATDSRNVKSQELQHADSEESINSAIAKEDMPADTSIKVEAAIKKDLEANPNLSPGLRAEANISDCASVLSEAVSYIQTNMELQSNPLIAQMQEDLKESKKKIQKLTESKNKGDTIRKQLEIETEELRHRIEVLSKSKTTEEKSKMDMELELRSLQFKLDHEVEEKNRLGELFNAAKDNLQSLESKHKVIVEENQSSDLSKKQLLMDFQKAEQSQKLMLSEIEDLKRLLEEEQKTRLIQEEMFNDQVNRSRDLTTETSKNIRQKQELLQQLTQAEEVCRNAELRNKTLSNDLKCLKEKHEAESKDWCERDMKAKEAMQKLESKIDELSNHVETNIGKLEERDAYIKDIEEKLRAGESELTISKHGFQLKENELSTSNKQLSSELEKLRLDYEKSCTERDMTKTQLDEMEGKLKTAEEVGTASANEQINCLNQKIGDIDTQLRFKTEEQEETRRKLRNAEEDIRQLELRIKKDEELQKMKEQNLSADAENLLQHAAQKDSKIQELEIEVGELQEKLLHSQHRNRDVQFELEELNKLVLEKSGAILTQEERDQVKENYVHNLEEQLSREREKFNKCNHDLEILNCKYEHVSEDKNALEMEMQRMAERLQMRDDSVLQVNDKLTETRTKLVEENEKARGELKRKNEALQEHISELRQKLVSAEAAKDMGEIEINRLRQEVKQQESSLRVKENTFKQYKTSLEEKNSELCEETKKIEKKLQELYTDRLHLKNELSNTKDALDEEQTLRKDVERKMDSLTLTHSEQGNDLIETRGNFERELQNKTHYLDLYKAEQEYSKQLKDEVSEMKKNISSLDSLNETLRNTIQEFKDSNREEKLGRTLASKELDETRQMLENEIKTRSHIGSRITSLERENQDLNNSLHAEQKKLKKTAQAKKISEANVDALQQNMTDLHKDIAELKDQLLYAQKLAEEGKVKEQKYNALKGKVQRDKLAQRRRVDELEKTLEDAHNSVRLESERRGQAEGNYLLLKNQVQDLQTQIQKLSLEGSTAQKSRQNAEVRCQQLQNELNTIHNKIGNELVTRDELEMAKSQAEGKARIELNRKLEEINLLLEEQSKARSLVESMRADNEEVMRRGFEKTAMELKKELNETKSALSKDAVNASTLATENRMIKSLLEKEQDHRKMLEQSLEETQRELQQKAELNNYNTKAPADNYNNYNTTPRKQYSDPSETLARMKARLNQSINKYLDEKINNDGSSDLWMRSAEGTPPELSPRTELARSGKASPRYMSIMKNNYFL